MKNWDYKAYRDAVARATTGEALSNGKRFYSKGELYNYICLETGCSLSTVKGWAREKSAGPRNEALNYRIFRLLGVNYNEKKNNQAENDEKDTTGDNTPTLLSEPLSEAGKQAITGFFSAYHSYIQRNEYESYLILHPAIQTLEELKKAEGREVSAVAREEYLDRKTISDTLDMPELSWLYVNELRERLKSIEIALRSEVYAILESIINATENMLENANLYIRVALSAAILDDTATGTSAFDFTGRLLYIGGELPNDIDDIIMLEPEDLEEIAEVEFASDEEIRQFWHELVRCRGNDTGDDLKTDDPRLQFANNAIDDILISYRIILRKLKKHMVALLRDLVS